MINLFKIIEGKLEALREGKLSQPEIDELVAQQTTLNNFLFHECRDGMMVIDANAKCVAVNNAQQQMLGYSRQELLSMHIWDWDSQLNQADILQILRENSLDGFRIQTRHRTKEGTEIDVDVSSNAFIYGGKKLAFVICRDISEQKRREQQIRLLSITDNLTGLYNRTEFVRLLSNEIERSKRYQQPLSVLMYDLDFFKTINDNYGHDVGDSVLIELTDLINQHIRQTDSHARWGGEEFMLLLPQTRLEKARNQADKLRTLIDNHQFSAPVNVTMSLGVVQHQPAEQIPALLKRVDDALYQAKNAGRNCVAQG